MHHDAACVPNGAGSPAVMPTGTLKCFPLMGPSRRRKSSVGRQDRCHHASAGKTGAVMHEQAGWMPSYTSSGRTEADLAWHGHCQTCCYAERSRSRHGPAVCVGRHPAIWPAYSCRADDSAGTRLIDVKCGWEAHRPDAHPRADRPHTASVACSTCPSCAQGAAPKHSSRQMYSGIQVPSPSVHLCILLT